MSELIALQQGVHVLDHLIKSLDSLHLDCTVKPDVQVILVLFISFLKAILLKVSPLYRFLFTSWNYTFLKIFQSSALVDFAQNFLLKIVWLRIEVSLMDILDCVAVTSFRLRITYFIKDLSQRRLEHRVKPSEHLAKKFYQNQPGTCITVG